MGERAEEEGTGGLVPPPRLPLLERGAAAAEGAAVRERLLRAVEREPTAAALAVVERAGVEPADVGGAAGLLVLVLLPAAGRAIGTALAAAAGAEVAAAGAEVAPLDDAVPLGIGAVGPAAPAEAGAPVA